MTTALTVANYLHGEEIYRVVLATPGGRPIHTGSGLVLQAQDKLERVTGPLDTLVVSGGIGYVKAMDDRRLVAHVRRLAGESRRVAAVCTGAGLLAAAGLLDGRRAATHWDHATLLTARFPQVSVGRRPDLHHRRAVLHLRRRDVRTRPHPLLHRGRRRRRRRARGGAAAGHLSPAARQPGADEHVHRRPGRAELPGAGHIDHVAGHLADDLSAAVLAERAGVSERHLTRLFLREVEVTPGRFVRRARTEAAAHLLTTTDLTMEAVASRCGFGTPETLRQAFQSRYGVSPSHYRATQARCAPLAGAVS